MNIQLLIIIAVITSSLLTLSQRANAQEISKQRWLEPNMEQLCCDALVPDQDIDPTDGSYFVTALSFILSTKKDHELFSTYNHPIRSLPSERIHPRAPPVFLI